MKATELLRNSGQSLWLDNITRDLLNDDTLKRYIEELSITGLTSNPTIFDTQLRVVPLTIQRLWTGYGKVRMARLCSSISRSRT